MVEIVATEDTLGGKPRLSGRRISVLQIAERAIELDHPPETIADQLDCSLAEVHAALSYYYEHATEMREERVRIASLEAELRDEAVEPPTGVEQ